jgi:hypothetical protein
VVKREVHGIRTTGRWCPQETDMRPWFASSRVAALVAPLVAALSVMATPLWAEGLRLLMVEQAGCYYCRIFNRDVAPIYDASREGQVAPLVHVQLRGPLPEGVTLNMPAVVTPTFILVGADGAEIERLTGYPGDHFFWPYVREMIEQVVGPLPQDDPAPVN